MNCTLTIYDATGQQILGDVQVLVGMETKLSTKNLAEGVYFVKFAYPIGHGYLILNITR
jgi:hypothetical protein